MSEKKKEKKEKKDKEEKKDKKKDKKDKNADPAEFKLDDARAQELVDRTKQLMGETDDDGWHSVKDKEGIKVETKAFPDIGPINCVRGNFKVDKSPKDTAKLVWEMKGEEVQETNPDLAVVETLDDISDTLKVMNTVGKVPWPLYSRELVYWQKFVAESDDKIWIVQESCEHPKAPLEKGNVRATLHLGSWCFEKGDDDKTVCWRFWHFDPSGNVPSFVINSKLDRFHGQLSGFQKAINK